jgi:hypothetical protein
VPAQRPEHAGRRWHWHKPGATANVTHALRLAALTRLARRLRITERTKAGAAVISAKARDLNEQYQIAEKTQALVADTRAAAGASLVEECLLLACLAHAHAVRFASAAGLIDKAKSHEAGQAVASAASWTRGFLQKAGAAAGDVVNAAKAKVEVLASESAVPPASPAPATQ